MDLIYIKNPRRRARFASVEAKGQKGRGLRGRNFCPFAIKNRAFPLSSD